MRFVKRLSIVCVLVVLCCTLSACQFMEGHSSVTLQPTVQPTNDGQNGLMNGWLSTYDQYVSNNGMLCLDWSGYQPASGTALICLERQFANNMYQHTSVGNYIMESIEFGRIYRIAIWYGNSSLLSDTQNQFIPEYAWHYFYIDYNKKILSSSKELFFNETPVSTCNSVPPTIQPTATPTPTTAPTMIPTVRPHKKPAWKPTEQPTATPSPTTIPDYSWHLRFTGINTDQDDNNSQNNDLLVGDTVYFHAHLTGGAPNEKILLYYEIRMNDEFIESSAFSSEFGDGSDIWVRNTPFRYGTLSIRMFYYTNSGNGREIELGHASVDINARDGSAQTEIAKGWISGCDVYFNRYGNLCFDLTNYNSSNKAIIWFSKNETSENMTQSTVVGGQILWDSPIPGMIYEYAIWCGGHDYSRDVATLGRNQIPSSAWIRLCVTDDHQLIIISSDAAINIKENE